MHEPRGRAVGAVDVEPQALAVAQVGEIVERVDGAGAGRARRADDAERRQADLTVDVQRGVDRRGLEPVRGVGAQHAQVGGVEAEHAPRLQDGAVRVLGHVARGLVAVVAAVLRGGGERGERADRAAADEDALGLGRHPHPVAQPVEHRELERRRARRRPVQLPANMLWPAPIRSASTLIGLLGLPIRAKNRGWSGRWPRGRIVVEQLVDRLLRVGRPVGARRDRARRPLGVGGAIGGCASSASQRSTSRSHTWCPRRRSSSGGRLSGSTAATIGRCAPP